MRKIKIDRLLLGISGIGFLLMSISFVLMPVESLKILPGALFWAGLLIGAVLQIVLEARRRALFKSYNVKREKMQKPRNGLLTCGSNIFAKIADIALGCSVIATILALILTNGTGYLCYVFIAVMAFSFCMHCIFNGRIYFYVINYNKIWQTLEKKKVSITEKGEGKK